MEVGVKLKRQKDYSKFLKFVIPSLIGSLLFITPIPVGGEITIGVGILAVYLQDLVNDYLPHFTVLLLGVSVLISLLTRISRPRLILNNAFLEHLFNISAFWLVIRILGFIFAILTFFKAGPEFIWSDATGGTVLYALVPVLITWFLFAGSLLPLLTDFGLMEFVGTLLRKLMRPLFTLPGRSSIDCLASWLGSGTVGVLVTAKQYDEGFYDKREAAVIATNFSISSIAFSLVVVSYIGLSHLFVQFYSTVVVAGLVAALILPRIPPLSRKETTYYEPIGKQIDEQVPEGKSYLEMGIEKAVEKAAKAGSAGSIARKGVENFIDIWFGLLPSVMALGTLALVITEYTPLFKWLSFPLVPVLNLMQIPEAAVAAQAFVVGFADMFLPAIVGSSITSELTRFVIACISMTQLIYMSEVGALLLRSNIPLSLWDLIVIFIQRTVITLPVVALMAHVFFF